MPPCYEQHDDGTLESRPLMPLALMAEGSSRLSAMLAAGNESVESMAATLIARLEVDGAPTIYG
jgi:hypothetical protein